MPGLYTIGEERRIRFSGDEALLRIGDRDRERGDYGMIEDEAALLADVHFALRGQQAFRTQPRTRQQACSECLCQHCLLEKSWGNRLFLRRNAGVTREFETRLPP